MPSSIVHHVFAKCRHHVKPPSMKHSLPPSITSLLQLLIVDWLGQNMNVVFPFSGPYIRAQRKKKIQRFNIPVISIFYWKFFFKKNYTVSAGVTSEQINGHYWSVGLLFIIMHPDEGISNVYCNLGKDCPTHDFKWRTQATMVTVI